jgi:RNA polymerase sigma-70 factor (ECF subfamily)
MRHVEGVMGLRGGGTPALDGLGDQELLRLARRDPEAFAVFYRRHVRSIAGFFVRRTACQETAADLTAETFAQAFLSRHRYRPTGSPAQAWLAAIARHQLAHFVRSAGVADRGRRRLGMRPVPAGDEPFDELIESFDARRNGGVLERAMGELSDGAAAAVRLRVVDGLAYAEVAARLGCTEVAARQRVARGLSHLSDRLEDTPTSAALEVNG